MKQFVKLERVVLSAFERTASRHRRVMSEDTESHFEATRTLKQQERDLVDSFVGQDVSGSVPDPNNVEESKQNREQMREEGQREEGKSNEANSDIDMLEIESDEPSRDVTDEIDDQQHQIAY